MSGQKELFFTIENDPYQHIIKLMCNRWKPYIIKAFEFEAEHYCRFSTFTKQLPITERVLSRNLKELEQDGIITKEVFPEVPPRVEYRLTDKGKSLLPLLTTMYDWGWYDMKDKGLAIDPLGEMWHGYREQEQDLMYHAYKVK